MRTLVISLLLLMLASPALARTQNLWLAESEARLAIEPDGTVSAVELEKSFGKVVDDSLRERIGAWRFEPVLVDGKPVPVTATASLRLRAEFDNGRQGRVSIVSARFIDPPSALAEHLSRNWRPPSYPADALRAGYGALVSLRVEVDNEGRAINVAGESSWLSGPPTNGHKARKMMKRFIDVSRKAVMTWQMPKPAESGSHHYTVPVRFMLDGVATAWRPVQWVQIEPEPWMLAADAAKVAALGETGQIARSDLRLLTTLEDEA